PDLCQTFPLSLRGALPISGLPVGSFALRPGPLMAAADRFRIRVEGKGGHAAKPNETIDTLLVSTHIVTALQSIVSRNADPLESRSEEHTSELQSRENLVCR